MKLCVSTLACPDWSLPEIITAAAAAGIEGIDFRGVGAELDITQLAEFTSGLADTLASLRANHLAMPCLNTSVALLSIGAQKWERTLEEFDRYLKLAGASGTGFLRIFGGQAPPGMPRAQAVALASRHLRQLLKMTPSNCIPLLETHDDWVISQQVMELIAPFDLDQVGVIWDVEHPYRKGEQPEATVAGLGKYLRHVHFKDGFVRNGQPLPKLLGEGDLPLKQCCEALRHAGYDGWICLETEKRWHRSAPDPEASLPQFVQFMRNLFPPRPLGSSVG